MTDYSKLHDDMNLICIQISRGFTDAGEFGLGLYLNENNIITDIHKGGEVYGEYKDYVKRGMKIESINGNFLSRKNNATCVLRRQDTNIYNINFTTNNIII